MPRQLNSVAVLQDWLALLDGMGESVAQTLAAHPDHSEREPKSPAPSSRAAELRDRLDETWRGLADRLEAARALAARVEGMLDTDEAMVREWQQTAKSTRERLAAAGGL
jgi:hypothetical protein